MRALGTNNVDNAARVCHAPSTVALKATLGVAATTCSYRDLIGTSVVTFVGSNPAKNQPVLMKYLYHAKKAGTTVVFVNPYLEPGMDAYWVPSDVESALFGTKIADVFIQVAPGGDRAFLRGALKALVEGGMVDRAFVERATSGFAALERDVGRCRGAASSARAACRRGRSRRTPADRQGRQRRVRVGHGPNAPRRAARRTCARSSSWRWRAG
jgi:anaerobic selenocysteine-containing dehydrogenase